jgi:ATP-binding cassette subfamily B protein
VDTHTEHKILEHLRSIMADKTSLIISHRVSSAKLASRIFVLQDGKLLEEGTHRQLMKSKQLYYDLYQQQLNEEQGL